MHIVLAPKGSSRNWAGRKPFLVASTGEEEIASIADNPRETAPRYSWLWAQRSTNHFPELQKTDLTYIVDAIIPVAPGRMRNIWFPHGRAEYVTHAQRKLVKDSVQQRDSTFLLRNEEESESGALIAAQDEPDPTLDVLSVHVPATTSMPIVKLISTPATAIPTDHRRPCSSLPRLPPKANLSKGDETRRASRRPARPRRAGHLGGL